MSTEREVWIVGEPEEGGAHAFHHSTCYVLDQIHNRDRARKIRISQVPVSYAPCQICAPGGRNAGIETATHLRPGPRTMPSVRLVKPGDRVEIQDLNAGSSATYRIVAPGEAVGRGKLSTDSALGSAVLSKEQGAVVEFTPPSGKLARVRIARIGRLG